MQSDPTLDRWRQIFPAFSRWRAGGANVIQQHYRRDDLGRLSPGALADIIIIDLSGRDTLRYGPVRDPVKSLIECGVGDDVDTVIIDGKVCMENRIIPGVDFRKLRTEAQAAAETIWATLPDWDPHSRNAEEACPYCYPEAG